MEKEERLSKVVGIATDGAAVMQGSKNGVVTRLRARRNYIIGVHCFPHHLELAFKDTVKEVPMLQKVETFLTNIYYFYHNSPLNRSNLKRSFQALGQTP